MRNEFINILNDNGNGCCEKCVKKKLGVKPGINQSVQKIAPWDALACKQRLAQAGGQSRDTLRGILAEVFEDTVARVSEMYSNDSDVRSLFQGAQFYTEEQPPLERVHPEQDTPQHLYSFVQVKMGDSIETAKMLKDDGYNPLVHVLADRQGCLMEARSGAPNQEKDILRRTDLFMHIAPFTPYAADFGCNPDVSHQYPLDRNFGAIYSHDVLVFRGRQRDGFPILQHPYRLDFISVAGMFRPELIDWRIAPHHVIGVKNKMRTIYRAALHHGNDALVLGAMGCGELYNPPYHTAWLFFEVLDEPEFRHRFRKVVFAMKNEMHYRRFQLAFSHYGD